MGVFTINSSPVLFAVSRGYVHRWYMLVQCPGNLETILRVDGRISPVPTLDYRGRTLVWDRNGNAAMVAHLWGGVLAFLSPPVTLPGVTATIPSRWMPLFF